MLSDVDERLLNYHRWLAKNDTSELVQCLDKRLGDWRRTKEEYDALKAYMFGQNQSFHQNTFRHGSSMVP